jgi:aerobic-type carbon monoxide dehydrogenase small subunit (CoxS/CutS family)
MADDPTTIGAHERAAVRLVVNGKPREGRATPRTSLADHLRHELGLHGTHVGCEHGACGACTVILDGEPTLACLALAVACDGAEVRTVEGLADGTSADGLSTLQRAFRERFASQCGFCTPGMLMAATALLEEDPDPSPASVRDALSGVLCRCTGYEPIIAAVLDAARATRIDRSHPGNV